MRQWLLIRGITRTTRIYADFYDMLAHSLIPMMKQDWCMMLSVIGRCGSAWQWSPAYVYTRAQTRQDPHDYDWYTVLIILAPDNSLEGEVRREGHGTALGQGKHRLTSTAGCYLLVTRRVHCSLPIPLTDAGSFIIDRSEFQARSGPAAVNHWRLNHWLSNSSLAEPHN